MFRLHPFGSARATASRLAGAILVLALLPSCSDNDRYSESDTVSIQIREDSYYYSGDNHYPWVAPGGAARVTLVVDDFHHGWFRVSVYDSLGVTIYRREYHNHDYYYHSHYFCCGHYYDDDFVDVDFTLPGAPGQWIVEIDYWDCTGEIALTIEDVDSLTDPFGPPAPITAPVVAAADREVAVDGIGRTLHTGVQVDGSGARQLELLRYTADGAIDPSFGVDGRFVFEGAVESSAFDVALDSEQRILVGGWQMGPGGNLDLLLLRLTADGALDPSFGEGGVVTFDDGHDDVGLRVAVDAADRVMVAGVSQDLEFGRSNAMLLRVGSDGKPDTRFARHGVFRSAMDDDRCHDFVLDDQGRGWLAGQRGDALAVWRVDPEGALDAEFADGGVATSLGPAGVFRVAKEIDLLPEGGAEVRGVEFDDDPDGAASPIAVRISQKGVFPE